MWSRSRSRNDKPNWSSGDSSNRGINRSVRELNPINRISHSSASRDIDMCINGSQVCSSRSTSIIKYLWHILKFVPCGKWSGLQMQRCGDLACQPDADLWQSMLECQEPLQSMRCWYLARLLDQEDHQAFPRVVSISMDDGCHHWSDIDEWYCLREVQSIAYRFVRLWCSREKSKTWWAVISRCVTLNQISINKIKHPNQSVKVIEMTININQEMNIIITRDGRDCKNEYSRDSKIDDDSLIVSRGCCCWAFEIIGCTNVENIAPPNISLIFLG